MARTLNATITAKLAQLFDLELLQGLGSPAGRSGGQRQDGGGEPLGLLPQDTAAGLTATVRTQSAAVASRGGFATLQEAITAKLAARDEFVSQRQSQSGPPQPVLQVLTPGPDNHVATPGNDTIDALDGDDMVFGVSGNDILIGSSGADRLFGGTGQDLAYGGHGNDYLEGVDGNDTLFGGGVPPTVDPAEVLVNPANNTDDIQSYVAPLAGGGYIVGWARESLLNDGVISETVFQRYNAAGAKVGGPIVFDPSPNTNSTDGQAKGEIEIAQLNDGTFIVTWFSFENPADDPPADVHSAFMARFDANGNQISATFELGVPGQTTTTSHPSITVLPNGNWIVVWQDQYRDFGHPSDGWGVYGQEFRPAGNSIAAVGAEFRVQTTSLDIQFLPRTTLLGNGNVLIAWTSTHDNPGGDVPDIYYAIYRPDSTGNPGIGLEMRANVTTNGTQIMVGDGAASLGSGGFVLVWHGNGAGDASGVFARLFDQNGNPISGEILVNTSTGGQQINAAVTHMTDGGFFVVWTSPDGNGTGILGQRFDAQGNRVGGEVLINTTVAGNQARPEAATLADGTVVVTWHGPDPIGGDLEVFQRAFRFSPGGGGDTLVGNGGNDSLFGEEANDTLFGQSGDDDLDGGGGIDTLFAGTGVDELFGGEGDDTLDGGTGADLVFGGSGSDFASYNFSDAAVTVDLSDNLLEAGGHALGDLLTGIEHLVGSRFGDTLVGLSSSPEAGGQNNTLIGNNGDDSLFGLDGNDTLFGGDHDDRLEGGANADYLDAGGGNDTLNGGAGNLADTLIGGVGQDIATYATSASAVTIDMSDGLTELGGQATGDFLTQIEILIGSVHNDILVAQDGGTVNSFYGGDGDDSLDGRQGGDLLDGGAGSDWASYTSSVAVNINLGAGTASGGQATGDSYVSIENLRGSINNDTLTGNLAANILDGFDGNDLLATGGPGAADTLIGGAGTDTATYASYGAGVMVDLLAGTGQLLVGPDVAHSLTEIENLIGSGTGDTLLGGLGANTLFGATGNDFVGGGAGNDTAFGGDGDDTLFDGGGAFADSFNGGAGNDTASYQGVVGAVAASLLANMGFTGVASGDFYSQVENLTGGGGGDTLIGDNGANSLQGLDGNDTLIAGLGADALLGGTGNDVIHYAAGAAMTRGGVGVDTLVVTEGNDSVNLGLPQFGGLLNGELEVIQLSGGDDLFAGPAGPGNAATNLTVFGGTGNDDLATFASANDSLFGGLGNDTLEGGGSADRLDGGAGSDVARYLASFAGVTVDLGDAMTEHGGTALGDELVSIENLMGSQHGDTLTGDGGVNWIQGLGGNDVLRGGLGADSLFGGLGNDTIFYETGDAVLLGGQGLDTLVATAGDDLIQIQLAPFQFDGATIGIETYYLGSGNDWFLGSSMVSVYSQLDLPGMTVFGGSGRDQIAMRGLESELAVPSDDYVEGGSGNDLIWGGWGSDTLFGGMGSDQLYSGPGEDTLIGGAGFDVYYVGRAEGQDTIVDDAAGNGLVAFWGFEIRDEEGFYDGVSDQEVALFYGGGMVTLNILDSDDLTTIENSVVFEAGDITAIQLWDHGNGNAGNGPTQPPAGTHDVWQATWTGSAFTSFTLIFDN